MILYKTLANKASEELLLNDTAFCSEAIEDGNKYYPGGFEVYSYDTDDIDDYHDIWDVVKLEYSSI